MNDPRMNDKARLFGTVITDLHAELDWSLLGQSYCEGDGSEFFDDELCERILDTGLLMADDVARALGGSERKRSVYLGAALAELAPILMEHLVLEREVFWFNLAGAETDELARALALVGERLGVGLPRPSAGDLAQVAPESCDHLWMVSVLTDPDVFPALHDELYKRTGGELATGRGDLADERRRANELADALLACAAPRSALTTTDEELAVLRPAAQRRGVELDVPRAGRLSAIVGDFVRVCRYGGGFRRAPDLALD